MSFFPHLMVLRMDAEIKLHELLLLFHYSLNLYEAFSVLSQEGGENNKSAQSTNSEQNWGKQHYNMALCFLKQTKHKKPSGDIVWKLSIIVRVRI